MVAKLIGMLSMAWAVSALSLDTSGDQGPIDFRCDNMRIETKPQNRTFCEKNVVLKRGTLLLCCDLFTGESDAKWVWQRFTCDGNVRALRNGEYMWSDTARFLIETNGLELTGRPLLKRGESVVGGEKITVDVTQDSALIHHPKGLLAVKDKKDSVTTSSPSTPVAGANVKPAPPPIDPLTAMMKKNRGVLPTRCPLPASPTTR